MSVRDISPIMLATAFALAGCGGDGGFGVASTPPPPVTPTPTPTPATPPPIIPAATTSQQFAAVGASHPFDIVDGDQRTLLDAGDQLQVRYVASSNSYEIQGPHSATWTVISFLSADPTEPINWAGSGAHLWLRSGSYQYSRLFEWAGYNSIYAHEAIGVATPAGGVPVSGSASYSGQLLGFTPENHSDGTDLSVEGSILLAFNFGAGSLSGSITPNLHQLFSLGTISFRDTVYSTGSTTFSGKFDTDVAGANSLSGLFTGPNAQELIGNWALPYKSPIDGLTYQADGAFVGAK
jgi:hypothetical protein